MVDEPSAAVSANAGSSANAVNLTQPAAAAVAPILQRSLASIALKIRQDGQGAYPCGAGGGE